ncbi:helix-turn-helix domain-containing protein [Streptomyces xantholiticus]|uniref:Helix-turn-helix domain-containing protein n=1 Tax=Streptomyces xantholiticus TaxID=68285 RepID=A0ABV1UT84_9ACTN
MNLRKRNASLPETFSAAEVAEALDCSEWWVKEQARRRRIPFLRSGSGYRFTKAHVEEIFHIIEERPDPAAISGQNVAVPAGGHTSPRSDAPVVVLRARRPRRGRSAA